MPSNLLRIVPATYFVSFDCDYEHVSARMMKFFGLSSDYAPAGGRDDCGGDDAILQDALISHVSKTCATFCLPLPLLEANWYNLGLSCAPKLDSL